jgi:hypothetical protein
MARFYSSLRADRGEVTKAGTAKSGLVGHVRGWNVGVEVVARDVDGADVFYIYVTKGSEGGSYAQRIGSVKLDTVFPFAPVFIPEG